MENNIKNKPNNLFQFANSMEMKVQKLGLPETQSESKLFVNDKLDINNSLNLFP